MRSTRLQRANGHRSFISRLGDWAQMIPQVKKLDVEVLGWRVIRAKVVGEMEVDTGNDIYGNPIKRIQYEVKQIKMFKGPDQDIEAIFTSPVSAVCGVTLDTSGKKEYLISGKASHLT
ncbi:metalloproteinase inhibitor 2-like [Salvelinus sp. IW2-2015]|uniref:metalloproteinase inhibitor 2-like n=1 Tax=Salvelinus sp. IW2-2015 TaxID=2691554 RepID=UPI0038D357D5